MISAIIIEDEVNNSDYLSSLLEQHVPDVIVRGVATGVRDGIRLIQEVKPSVVFLDIELSNESGFDILAGISTIDFSVIFTTAHERYSLKAIKFAALDYLLKPIDPAELKAAVAKALVRDEQNSMRNSISVLLENIQKQAGHKQLAVSTSSAVIMLTLKDILYMKSDGPYTTIMMTGKSQLSSRHLKEYEDLLREFDFFRVHKSFLVNLSEIKQFSRSEGWFLVMSNGDRIVVSDKKKEELLKRLSAKTLFVK